MCPRGLLGPPAVTLTTIYMYEEIEYVPVDENEQNVAKISMSNQIFEALEYYKIAIHEYYIFM